MKMNISQVACHRFTVDVDINKDTFVQDAANQIAKLLIANGCLVHRSKYDICRQMWCEEISLYVGKKERKLP